MRAERFEYTAEGWGTGEVWVRDGLLVHHELASGSAQASRPAASAGLRQGRARTPEVTIPGNMQHGCAEFVSELCRRFAAHLAGREVEYGDVPIELEWCTALQRDLALALREVAWGEVVSYGELAQRAGRPRAPRAAGSFCAQNQLQLVLPCHRVVSANGIGGYGVSGVGLKRRLLALEGVVL